MVGQCQDWVEINDGITSQRYPPIYPRPSGCVKNGNWKEKTPNEYNVSGFRKCEFPNFKCVLVFFLLFHFEYVLQPLALLPPDFSSCHHVILKFFACQESIEFSLTNLRMTIFWRTLSLDPLPITVNTMMAPSPARWLALASQSSSEQVGPSQQVGSLPLLPEMRLWQQM